MQIIKSYAVHVMCDLPFKIKQKLRWLQDQKVHVNTVNTQYESSLSVLEDEAIGFIYLRLDGSSSTSALDAEARCFSHTVSSGSTGVHFLHAAFPEGHQSIIFVGTKVCEIS